MFRKIVSKIFKFLKNLFIYQPKFEKKYFFRYFSENLIAVPLSTFSGKKYICHILLGQIAEFSAILQQCSHCSVWQSAHHWKLVTKEATLLRFSGFVVQLWRCCVHPQAEQMFLSQRLQEGLCYYDNLVSDMTFCSGGTCYTFPRQLCWSDIRYSSSQCVCMTLWPAKWK